MASVSQPAGDVDERETTDRDDRVRCRRCEAALTRPSRAVARAGHHQHTFRNPAGYSWTVACFSGAPGCGVSGEPTTEATWFAGYAWRFAHCATCGRHVGWWFVGDSQSFVALIVTRIVA